MDKIDFEAVPATLEELESKFVNEIVDGNGGLARRIAQATLTRSSDYFYNQDMDEET